MSNTIRINFELDKDIHLQAKELALKKETTIKDLYTKWIVDGIEKETNQTRLNVE